MLAANNFVVADRLIYLINDVVRGLGSEDAGLYRLFYIRAYLEYAQGEMVRLGTYAFAGNVGMLPVVQQYWVRQRKGQFAIYRVWGLSRWRLFGRLTGEGVVYGIMGLWYAFLLMSLFHRRGAYWLLGINQGDDQLLHQYLPQIEEAFGFHLSSWWLAWVVIGVYVGVVAIFAGVTAYRAELWQIITQRKGGIHVSR